MRNRMFRILLVLFLFTAVITPVFARSLAVAVINDPDGYTNVRAGRGTGYRVVSKVYKNEYFLVQRSKNQWWKVLSPDKTPGFMHSSRIKVKRYDAKGAGIINDPDGYTNVRSGPSTKYRVLERVHENEVFIILKYGAWYKIITRNGTVGYMHSSRVKSLRAPK